MFLFCQHAYSKPLGFRAVFPASWKARTLLHNKDALSSVFEPKRMHSYKEQTCKKNKALLKILKEDAAWDLEMCLKTYMTQSNYTQENTQSLWPFMDLKVLWKRF